MSKNDPIKCNFCGKFIGYNDKQSVCEYTPLSEFTKETFEWTCYLCQGDDK